MEKTIVALAAVLSMSLTGCGAPSPEEVCTHIAGVYAKDPKASEYKKFDQANCVSNGNIKKELPAYRTYGTCAKKADTIAAVNECAKAMDAALR
jgi:hypothetical protein